MQRQKIDNQNLKISPKSTTKKTSSKTTKKSSAKKTVASKHQQTDFLYVQSQYLDLIKALIIFIKTKKKRALTISEFFDFIMKNKY